MNSLMSMIDDVKTKLTDQEYKQLCDKMMEMNNEKQCDYYEIIYVEPRIRHILEDGSPEYVQGISFKKRTVKLNLTNRNFEFAKKQIEENGVWCDDTLKENQSIKDILEEQVISTVIVESENYSEYQQCYIMPPKAINIISIKKL